MKAVKTAERQVPRLPESSASKRHQHGGILHEDGDIDAAHAKASTCHQAGT